MSMRPRVPLWGNREARNVNPPLVYCMGRFEGGCEMNILDEAFAFGAKVSSTPPNVFDCAGLNLYTEAPRRACGWRLRTLLAAVAHRRQTSSQD